VHILQLFERDICPHSEADDVLLQKIRCRAFITLGLHEACNRSQMAVQKSISQRRRREEELETKMLQSVFNGMLGEDGIIKDCEETLNVANQVWQRRREKLHADWSQNVHGKIQQRIQEALKSMSVADIEKKLRRASHLNDCRVKALGNSA
jgi:hypothetical protein